MNRDDSRAPYEPVLEQMLLAGWIEEYAFTSRAKIAVIWTEFGSARAWMLRGIVRSHDKHPGAHSNEGGDAGAGVTAENSVADAVHPNEAAYCDMCVRELNLSRSEGQFLVLIYVIEACPPKVESGNRVGETGSDRMQLEVMGDDGEGGEEERLPARDVLVQAARTNVVLAR
jgi:hypothetical protein